MTALTSEYLDKQLKAQTKELKSFTQEQTAELATMVKKGFDHVDDRLDEIEKRLDVKRAIENI